MAKSLATHWIADAVADDESFNFSILQMVLGASSAPLAGAPEATRERVALRSLLEVSSQIHAAGDATATAGAVRVDVAWSWEDVLSRLVNEVEISGILEKDLLPPFSQDIQETIRTKKFTLPETSFQLLKGVDPWITSMTPTSQLEHSGTEQCANDQTLCSSHECVNIEKPVFPTDNAEVQQDTMANSVNECETGNLQKDPSAPACVLHQPCTPESRPYVPLQEDTMDAVGLGARSPERSPILEGNMSVGSVLASAGCDAPLQGSFNGANLQQRAATEDRMDFEEQNLGKAPLEVCGANKAYQALHDDGSMMKNNTDHGGLTVQTAPVSQNCNDNCRTSIPSSSKDRDRERAKKTSNEEKSEDTSPDNRVHGRLTVQAAPVSQNCNDDSIPSSSKDRDRERAKKTSNEEKSEDTSPDNRVHGRLTVQAAPVSQNCNDDCHTSIPSSSKDRDRDRAKKTSNEEKSEESVHSKDQVIDDTLEGLSQQGLCIVCSKDGELLTCSDCSLAAHGSCFGPKVTLDGTDLFYCPICSCKKARKSYLKSKKKYSKSKEDVAAYVGTAQVSKQHGEQLNGVQPGAANRDGHCNGCDTSKRNIIHQSEAYDLDEEPHQPSKKQKINAGVNGYLKEVLTEKVPFQNSGPASMNKQSGLQNNSETRVEDPEKKQQAGDKETHKEAGSYKSSDETTASSQRGCDPLNQDDAADQEDSHTAPKQSGGKRSSHSKKRLHEKDSSVPRKRRAVRRQKRYSNPVAGPRRRQPLLFTEEEEAILTEGMAKFAPQDDAPIPWTRILEYGSHVFHKTRLGVDLKDKWRNMMRNKKKTDAGN